MAAAEAIPSGEMMRFKQFPNGGLEYANFYETVHKRVERPDGSRESVPTVVLDSGQDRWEVPAAEFMQWQINAGEREAPVAEATTEAGDIAVDAVVDVESIPVTSEINPPSPLETAKQSYSALTDPLFDDDTALQTALGELTPAERTQYDQWQVEQAAVRKPSLWEIVNQSPKNDAKVREVPEELTEQFKEALTAYGFTAEVPTEDQIAAGIERAKQLVDSGQALSRLASLPFIDEKQAQALSRDAKISMIRFDGQVSIDPDLISGCSGHDSWAGRGPMGGDMTKTFRAANGEFAKGSGKAIMDFATQPTQLPEMDYLALQMILTAAGPVFFADGSSHRVSAAKLRGEPLRISSLDIHDAR